MMSTWCGFCRKFNGTRNMFGSLVCKACNCEVEAHHAGNDRGEVNEDHAAAAKKNALAPTIASAIEHMFGPEDSRVRASIVGDICAMIGSPSIAATATCAGTSVDSREVAVACLIAVVLKRKPEAAFAIQTRCISRLLGTTEAATRSVQEHMAGVEHVLAADLAALAERKAPPGSLSRAQLGDLGLVCRSLADDINAGRDGRPAGSKLATRVAAAVNAALRQVTARNNAPVQRAPVRTKGI
jgi:hypothetical protein